MAKGIVIVGTSGIPTPRVDASLEWSRELRADRNWHVRVAAGDTPDVVRRLRQLIQSGERVSAAVLAEVPPAEGLWVATEWWNRLVVGAQLLDLLGPERDHWTQVGSHGTAGLLVLAPTDVGARPGRSEPPVEVEGWQAYRDSLGGDRPTVCRADLEAALSDQERWFGDLAESRRGGAVALVTLSARKLRSGETRLGNPAAFGLSVADDTGEPAPVLGRLGPIAVRAFGLSRGQLGHPAHELLQQCQPDEARRALAALQEIDGFAIAMFLSALVDPAVRIPKGLVMSQPSLNGVQTLAVAAPSRTVVVAPGPLLPIVVPAWCLNEELSPPAGEPVRPTPLVLSAPEEIDQRAVWRWIAQSRESLRA